MTTPRTPPPPRLATLHTPPSWHNRAGRVDRSACFVLRAAELWRRIPDHNWRITLRDPHTHAPDRPPAGNAPHHFGKPDRHAELTLHARDLWLMHRHQPPYPLRGDLRSAKSNALRAQTARKNNKQPTRDDPVLGRGPINPNRGVGFNMHKALGLDCLWQTTLRLQRVVQHARLKQHFLLCPVCSGGADIPVCQSAEPNRTALGGTSPPANKQTKRPPKRPGGRVTKLYLPLCTPREYEDARTAELWLRNHPRNITHPNRPLTPEATQLIERYGELFASRNLRCRHCLGLRYGEVKPIGNRPEGRGNARAASHRAPAVRQEPHTPIDRVQTEQQLFLQNLPKLLAKPTAETPPAPRADPQPSDVSDRSARPASDRGTPTPRSDPPPPADQDELLLALLVNLPAFKALAKAKQLTK